MVLYFHSRHTFNHDFETVTLAYFNRYPNPFAGHVKSIDTIDRFVDSEGNLHQTKLIRKEGRLPRFIRPFLGQATSSWIVEKTMVDPISKIMRTYNCNLDHTRMLRVEERVDYQFDSKKGVTKSDTKVTFISGFKNLGLGLSVKDRIEDWSKRRFDENLKRSREGLKIVMDNVRSRLQKVPA